MEKVIISGTFNSNFGQRVVEEVNKDPRANKRFYAQLGHTWQYGGIDLGMAVDVGLVVIEVATFIILLFDHAKQNRDLSLEQMTQSEAKDLYQKTAQESQNELNSIEIVEGHPNSTAALNVHVKSMKRDVAIQVQRDDESLNVLLETEGEEKI